MAKSVDLYYVNCYNVIKERGKKKKEKTTNGKAKKNTIRNGKNNYEKTKNNNFRGNLI